MAKYDYSDFEKLIEERFSPTECANIINSIATKYGNYVLSDETESKEARLSAAHLRFLLVLWNMFKKMEVKPINNN